MKRKFTALILAMTMTFAVALNASATEVPADGISSYEEAASLGYDDYLEESMARGTSVPSVNQVYDLSSGDYRGVLNNIRTGIYTNYCFYPSSSGQLTFGWNVKANEPLNGSKPNWKVLVGIYDMSGKYIVETKGGAFHSSFGPFYAESVTFSGLDLNTKYCFFISVYNEACQIVGNCWVSN